MLILDEKIGPIAQLEEPPAHNRSVPGSNPGGPTKISECRMHTKEFQKETCFIGKGAPERCALSIQTLNRQLLRNVRRSDLGPFDGF